MKYLKSDQKRTARVFIRLTKSESEKLEQYAARTGLSKTEVIMRGLQAVYEKGV